MRPGNDDFPVDFHRVRGVRRLALSAAVVLAAAASSVGAQSAPTGGKPFAWLLQGAYSSHGADRGFGADGGVSVWRRAVSLNLIPADITWVQVKDSNSPYYLDSFSNGQERCRDRRTGRFVETARCDPSHEVRWAVAGELNAAPRVLHPLLLGAGVRHAVAATGPGTAAYGTVGLITAASDSTHVWLRASAGNRFWQIAIGTDW